MAAEQNNTNNGYPKPLTSSRRREQVCCWSSTNSNRASPMLPVREAASMSPATCWGISGPDSINTSSRFRPESIWSAIHRKATATRRLSVSSEAAQESRCQRDLCRAHLSHMLAQLTRLAGSQRDRRLWPDRFALAHRKDLDLTQATLMQLLDRFIETRRFDRTSRLVALGCLGRIAVSTHISSRLAHSGIPRTTRRCPHPVTPHLITLSPARPAYSGAASRYNKLINGRNTIMACANTALPPTATVNTMGR